MEWQMMRATLVFAIAIACVACAPDARLSADQKKIQIKSNRNMREDSAAEYIQSIANRYLSRIDEPHMLLQALGATPIDPLEPGGGVFRITLNTKFSGATIYFPTKANPEFLGVLYLEIAPSVGLKLSDLTAIFGRFNKSPPNEVELFQGGFIDFVGPAAGYQGRIFATLESDPKNPDALVKTISISREP